jgi:YHS domain-containing protein
MVYVLFFIIKRILIRKSKIVIHNLQIDMQSIDITIQYEVLLRFQVSHNFFGDEKPNIFVWQPTRETQQLFNQMGIMVRYAEDTILLLISNHETPLFYQKLQENPNIRFSFLIYSENVYFNHFTHVPLEQKGKAYYFQNQPKKKTFLLHPNDFVAQTDTLPIGAGKWVLGEQKTGNTYTLAHEYLPTEEELTANEHGNVIADLQHLPVGKYTLSSKAKTEATFIHAPMQAGKILLGLADFDLDENMAKEWLKIIEQGKEIQAQHYQIKFEARSTYWRYYFIPKYANNLTNTEIESNGLGLEFSAPTQVTLPNGLEATCFEAKKQMKLQKKHSKFMQLIRRKDNKGNNIRQVLCKIPLPSFEGLRAESRQLDAKVFSEVVVYV